jgi:hypothetical protein
MNRTIALLLASAVLLAHMLAIHKDAADALAPPYEVAHVAFREAHDLAQHGVPCWDPTVGGASTYPSLLWVALAAIPERFQLDTGAWMQVLSALCALLTVWVLARFSPVRLAGVIAPLLFVASGAIASAAGSGTEMTLAALLVSAAYLSYERSKPRAFAVLASLACLTRPEVAPLWAALLAIELARRARRSSSVTGRIPLAAFWWPAGTVLAAALLRLACGGGFLSPWGSALLDPSTWQPLVALRYLRDFFVSSGPGLLAVFPLWYLARGALTGVGRRALALSVAWCALSTLGGAGPQSLPFSQFMVPILALLLVALQEAMTVALDSRRRGLPQLTWALFLIGLVVSALASKFPGDLGPLPLDRWQIAWMKARSPRRLGQSAQLGRDGLQDEIQRTSRLRGVGAFLRDKIDPELRVLSPWPGALGYLSGLRVLDALGRVTPPSSDMRARPWGDLSRSDLVAALEQRPDYILPTLARGVEGTTLESLAEQWSDELDQEPRDPTRRARVRELLTGYELITVPSAKGPGDSYCLMRSKALGLSPVLSIGFADGALSVEVRHAAHEQLVDLLIELEDERGGRWSMRPSGELAEGADVRARRAILLFPTGERAIELVRARLPQVPQAVRARALLLNPGSGGADAPVCPEVALELH